MKLLSFSAEIFIIGVNPYVYFPKSVLEELFGQSGKDKGAIPVKGKINGKDFSQTLVKYAGAWRLYINGVMRKAAGVDVGSTVLIEIAYDPIPRLESMPSLFKDMLEQYPKAKEAFEHLAPSRKKEILRYLNFLKSEETLKKNVDIVIAHLLGKKPKEPRAFLPHT